MERLDGKDYYVKLSSGATFELYSGLIVLASRRPHTTTLRELSAFLRKKQISKARRGIGFSLAPPPPEITSCDSLHLFSELLAEFALELCKDRPDPALCDIDWDRELRFRWLHFVVDLRGLVLEAAGANITSLELPLSDADEVRLEFERLLWRKTVLARSKRRREAPGRALDSGAIERVSPSVALAILDELIALCEQLMPSDPARRHLAGLLHDRADVLLADGKYLQAADALRTAAAHETEPELRSATLEYAAVLVKEHS